jgi:hypothetical protein
LVISVPRDARITVKRVMRADKGVNPPPPIHGHARITAMEILKWRVRSHHWHLPFGGVIESPLRR